MKRGEMLAATAGKIKNWILNLADWSKKHLEKLIILIGTMILFSVLFVLLSWFIGYYCNGFFGMRFELSSVWQGLGACVTAISGLLTLAGVNLAKHYVDSRYNSPTGEKPGSRRDMP